MKKLILLFSLVITAVCSKAQDANGVVNALKSGSSDQVSGYFDRMIDIKFPDKDEVKSIGKNQASIALKSFFNNNNIKGFELSSQREMGGTMYIAGKLVNGGEGYKISIMLKTSEGRPLIMTIRIS